MQLCTRPERKEFRLRCTQSGGLTWACACACEGQLMQDPYVCTELLMLRITVVQKSSMSSGFVAKWIKISANFAKPNNPSGKYSEVTRYPNYPVSPHKSAVITQEIHRKYNWSSEPLITASPSLYRYGICVCKRGSYKKYICMVTVWQLSLAGNAHSC